MLVVRLILLLVQLAAAFYGAPYVIRYLPKFGQLDIFVYAIVVALIVWLVGMIAGLVIKDLGQPSSAALMTTLVLALVFAGLTLVPQVTSAVSNVVKGVPTLAYPLLGAVLGYLIKR